MKCAICHKELMFNDDEIKICTECLNARYDEQMKRMEKLDKERVAIQASINILKAEMARSKQLYKNVATQYCCLEFNDEPFEERMD